MPTTDRPQGTAAEVFAVFLKLGLTSFGGPVAHLGYFRDEVVTRRRWLGESAYADLVALCQFLPGPASSQVGFALGMMRAGWLGALAAFVAFTLPSALILLAFAMGAASLSGPLFTFAAYLGAVIDGPLGAGIALLAVFLPGFLILVGVLPFWDRFRQMARAQSLMQGANAAVVGILGAALYAPVFTGAIGDMRDFALALACFVALVAWKTPPWAVVALAALGGAGLAFVG